jgi:hypothetical protein
MTAPIAITIRKTAHSGITPKSGYILLGYPAICKSEAATQAVSPTALPAEISVPVRTIHPAIPKAIGNFDAVSEMIFTTDDKERNDGTLIAIKMIATAIIIYIALLKSISVIIRFLSLPGKLLKTENLPEGILELSDIITSCKSEFIAER